jgi:hypothetical protein
MTYYINELSVQNPCVETEILARKLITDFIAVCRKAKGLGLYSIAVFDVLDRNLPCPQLLCGYLVKR